jgi:hypothetical protein
MSSRSSRPSAPSRRPAASSSKKDGGAAREVTPDPQASVPRSQISGYRRSKEKGIQMIGVTLPEAYLRIIDTERELMGSSRNHFMSQLVLRKAGLLPLERPKHAPPKYEVKDEELRSYKFWTWYMKPDVKKLLDADMLQMGKRKPGDWITSIINDWLGKPGGLRS